MVRPAPWIARTVAVTPESKPIYLDAEKLKAGRAGAAVTTRRESAPADFAA